jgi:hypothetical protein
LAAFLLFLPVSSWSQSVQSGNISGVVRDESGGVLPGVTVEAASPALIEKVRTVDTDSAGVYRIVDLRPGVYTVTFTLSGFATFKREGVELSAGFTATVNGDMKVGALEETVVVSGAAPIVDTQSIIQQQVISRELRDALPLPSNSGAYVVMILGATQVAANQDVGGTRGENTQQFMVHGSRAGDFQQLRDGMYFGTLVAAGNYMSSVNPTSIQEVSVLTAGGLTAESETGGAQINIVPRDGGNTFHGSFHFNFGHQDLQTSNLDANLRARGLTSTDSIKQLTEIAGGVGGPIKQDKLWFYASARNWVTNRYLPGNYYNKRQGTLFYEADLGRPAYEDNFYRETTGRLTWQAARKHKIAGVYSAERNCNCNFNIGNGLLAPEAAGDDFYWPNWRMQSTWSYPATNRLLFEAGMTVVEGKIQRRLTGSTFDDISVLDLARNYRYGAPGSAFGLTTAWGSSGFGNVNERFAFSYVTGSHALKVGVQHRQAHRDQDYFISHNLAYTFRGTVPQSVTYYAGPYFTEVGQRTIALFAQDQWTIQRLTLNLGLRYDYLNGWIPAQHIAAGPYVGERNFEKIPDALNWHDLSPRLGLAYDLFGNGRTAVKAFLGRYAGFQSNAGLLQNQNPVERMITSSTRTWTDNGDYIPHESELGPHSVPNFGQLRSATQFNEGLLTGFGVREYSWQGSMSAQHELRPGLAVNVGYFRTWYGNFSVTDNLDVTASDYDTFCITGPSDSRLPDGGGERICGLVNLNPTKFGRVTNMVTKASNFGDQTEVYNGVDLTMSARFGGGGQLSGGVSVGRTVTDNCEILAALPEAAIAANNASPQRTCHSSMPWSAGLQVKVSGVYPLPWNFRLGGGVANITGIPTTASYVVNQALATPGLGRPLSGGANATAIIELIEPNEYYTEGRNTQVNLRISRRFQWNGRRIEPQVDLFNAFNSNQVLVMTTRYGDAWQNVSGILAPRLIKLGVQVDF